MSNDDWWTRAVDQFGLEPSAATSLATPVADDTAPDEPAPTGRHRRRRRRRRRSAVEWLVIAAVAITAALMVRVFVVQQFAVDGDSMLGTLHSGDRVVVNKLSYRLHDPRHGDIVVLEDSRGSFEPRDLIKRVIGLPGETVEYRDCKLLIDGREIDETYLDPAVVQPGNCGDEQAPVLVRPGHVFVMGDNRSQSLDSRTSAIGQIPFDDVIGRAFLVVWPSADWRWL